MINETSSMIQSFTELQLIRRRPFFVSYEIQQLTKDKTESEYQTTRIAMSPYFPLSHNYQPGNTHAK